MKYLVISVLNIFTFSLVQTMERTNADEASFIWKQRPLIEAALQPESDTSNILKQIQKLARAYKDFKSEQGQSHIQQVITLLIDHLCKQAQKSSQETLELLRAISQESNDQTIISLIAPYLPREITIEEAAPASPTSQDYAGMTASMVFVEHKDHFNENKKHTTPSTENQIPQAKGGGCELQ